MSQWISTSIWSINSFRFVRKILLRISKSTMNWFQPAFFNQNQKITLRKKNCLYKKLNEHTRWEMILSRNSQRKRSTKRCVRKSTTWPYQDLRWSMIKIWMKWRWKLGSIVSWSNVKQMTWFVQSSNMMNSKWKMRSKNFNSKRLILKRDRNKKKKRWRQWEKLQRKKVKM